MKVPMVLAVLTGITLLAAAIGCSTTPAEVAPTPNIEATVEARVAQELAAQPKPNIDATVEARLVQKLAAQPTAIPYPTYTPVPTATGARCSNTRSRCLSRPKYMSAKANIGLSSGRSALTSESSWTMLTASS